MKTPVLSLKEQESRNCSLCSKLSTNFSKMALKLLSSKWPNNVSYMSYRSRTGTGKTLSFLLPLEELIRENKLQGVKGIQAIILEPTRELASQVQTQVEKYTNLSSVLVYGGGVSRDQQSKEIKVCNLKLFSA